MERLAGRVVGIGCDEEGNHRVTIAVVDALAPSRAPLTYTLVLDAESSAMEPEGELAECFEVFHDHEYGDDLNPRLRRQWKTAHIADEIVLRLLTSRALTVVRADADDA